MKINRSSYTQGTNSERAGSEANLRSSDRMGTERSSGIPSHVTGDVMLGTSLG